MPLRIVQLTDFHLHDDPEELSWGIPTRETFGEVLGRVRAEFADAEFFVLTGDLTHEGSESAHEELRRQLGDLLLRCRLVPGNHDHPDFLRQFFPEVVAPKNGPLTFSEPAGHWRLIGLDTQLPGEVGGRLGTDQLDWLRAELATHSSEPTVLFLHHLPIGTASPWLDRIGLEDAAALGKLFVAAPQVRLICTGHIHQELCGTLAGADVLATPSTGVQFRPDTEVPEGDPIPPGFRVLELGDDFYTTRIIRLDSARFEVRGPKAEGNP